MQPAFVGIYWLESRKKKYMKMKSLFYAHTKKCCDDESTLTLRSKR